ncbi:MAG: DUF5908 family protein [Chitinophagaceae bacterium]
MPIIIEEMTMQVEINQPGNGNQPTATNASTNDANKDRELIRKAVEETLEIIRYQNER